MDTSYQLTEEQRQEKYLEAEPYLTISDFKSVEKNLEGLSEKYNKLEKTIQDLRYFLIEKSIEVPEFLKT